LIQWLPRLAVPGPVAIVGPTYSEHAIAWANAGHEVVEGESLERLPQAARHAVVVNPNNPDGRIADLALINHVRERLAGNGGWLVIDESFIDVCPEFSAAKLVHDGALVVLRSFGKFYGLAGIRLGFAITTEAIGREIASALGPWAVSGPAIAVGRAAL